MADNLRKPALDNYALICQCLDELEIKYEKEEDKLSVHFPFMSEQKEVIYVGFYVRESQQLISLNIFPDYKVNQSKIIEMAIATSQFNYFLYDGSLDLNVGTGEMLFRMTSNFWDSLLSVEVIKQMLVVGINSASEKFSILKKLNNDEVKLDDIFK